MTTKTKKKTENTNEASESTMDDIEETQADWEKDIDEMDLLREAAND